MSEPKDALSVLNRLLPNFNTFIKVVLKREKLSEEAESIRAHYEVILKAMEEGNTPPRPISLIGDDDSGYHSTKPKGGFLPDQIPSVYQSGFLLKRDDKYRWHRYWCKVDGKDMKFFVYSDSNEETLIKKFPLETVTSLFGPPQTTECDKENCFILSGILEKGNDGDIGSSEEIYLAAYSDADYQQWRAALSLLTGTRGSMRMSSASFLDSSQWAAMTAGNDGASTSSSNFSSNRESMISTTSSLPYVLRPPSHDSPPRGRSPLEQGVSAIDTSTLSTKQQQPLPSPPHEDGEEDDNASVGTIYENVDNLVMQFDSTMQATVQAMGQVGHHLKSSKKHKKKDRSLLRQASFFKGSKSHKSKLTSKQKSELEKGETYSGYLYKRSSSGSWKKKWCVLKGAVLSYSKNPEDTEGREYVVLDAQIEKVTDPKRTFAFTVQLRGVPEPLCFGTEDEQVMNDWITRLENASNTKGDFDWDQWPEDEQSSQYHSQTSLDSMGMSESHYNVPRTILAPEEASQASALQILSADDAINSGIYSAPRSIPVSDASTFSVHGQSFSLSADPFAQYDVPRPVCLTPDEEAIYDYPENVVDMEIYDYPPDALSFLPPPPDMYPNPIDSSRNSVITLTSEFASSERSSLALPEDWNLPPPPVSLSSSRPSIAISTASSDEYYQSARNSVASMEGLYDRPRSHTTETLLAGLGESIGGPAKLPTDTPESSLEFGVCLMRGYLYKKERFTWNKMHCQIRNSFLECHKISTTHGPSLKLFLPRSSITPDKEAKRQWAIKVKHPRREGVLQFAAENEEEYKRWMNAFNSAAAIEVQSVNTVEEMRITDLDMQQRWTTLERKTSTLKVPDTSELQTKQKKGAADPAPQAVRRNTYSAGDEYMSDTLKRRRKFSWIKNLAKKRGMHHTAVSVGQLDYDPQQKEHAWRGIPDSSTTAIVAQEDRARYIMTEDGVEQFQGSLNVQRKGADNMWVRYWCVLEDLVISCYISKNDLTLTLSIQLRGSRVAEAIQECRRDYSFKIWHLESGQCLFFAADDNIEYGSWFKEVTKGAEYVVPLDAGISNSPLSAPFYHYAKDVSDSSPSQRSSRSSIASLPEIDNASLENATTSNSGSAILQRGNLKKLSQNKWKDRYCLIRDGMLHIYNTSTEKSLLSSVPLPGCRVELVNVPNEEVHRFTFRVAASSGKSHMFSASSEQEMYTWAITLQDCSHTDSKADAKTKGNKKHSSSKLKDLEELVSYVPASKLSNPVYAGYCEVLLMGSWNRYWCVVHTGCLYLYTNQESQATIRTIVLKGYDVSVGGPQGCKKPCVIMLQYPGVTAVYMAVLDQIELTKWFNALEHGSKMESLIKQHKAAVEAQKKREVQTAAAIRQPMKTTVETKTDEEATLPKNEEDKESKTLTRGEAPLHQNATIRRYEKKIRKTHRVANLTEQNLKQQQTSLLHFKRELSRLTSKLQEMADKGDEHAAKRLKNLHVKLQQIEKIIPYIGKYIMVNRQAEIQTVAILKESCAVEVQRVKMKGNGAVPQRSSGLSPNSAELHDSTPNTSIHPKLNTHLETHFEETETGSTAGTEPPTPQIATEPPSQVLQSSLQMHLSSDMETLPSVSVHTALLDKPQKIPDPPYANLTAVQTEVVQIQDQMSTSTENYGEKVESPFISVRQVENNSSKSQEVGCTEVKKSVSPTSPPKSPSSNYAELDFARMQQKTSTPPSARLNYIQVEFDPNKGRKLKEPLPSQARDMDATLADSVDEGKSVLEKTLTPENAAEVTETCPVSPAKSPAKSRMSAMQDAIKLFEPSNSSTPIKSQSTTKPGPPPVKRKPKQQSSSATQPSISTLSPSHSSRQYINSENEKGAEDLLQSFNADSVDHTADAQSVTAGTMSVMERIKVLQKQT